MIDPLFWTIERAAGLALILGVVATFPGLLMFGLRGGHRGGAAAYFFGGVLSVAAEALNLKLGYEQVYGLIVAYVVTAFLAQAAIGGAVLQSGLLAAWIGWVTILWNIAWLIVLSIFARRDMYFPVLHHFAPLLIGVALLTTAS